LHVEKLEYLDKYKGQNETNIMQIELNQLNGTKWITLINRVYIYCSYLKKKHLKI